jgi:hypothetical protein
MESIPPACEEGDHAWVDRAAYTGDPSDQAIICERCGATAVPETTTGYQPRHAAVA